MRNVSSKIFLVFATLLLLAGCRGAPIYYVKDASLANEGKSMEEVGKAIKRAGRGLGWDMKDEAEGKIRGTLNIRTHRAVVIVTHNTKTFNIDYVSSTNLNYNAENNEIHRNYNNWVQNLEKAIRVQMSE